MVFWTAFLLSIAAVNSFPVDSSDCFNHKENNCTENFKNVVHNSNTAEDRCSELRKFADCLTDAVVECFGDDHNENVLKNLERLENDIKSTCGADASGDRSDFDSSKCFQHKERKCEEHFRDALQNSYTKVNACSALRKFIDCIRDSVDECHEKVPQNLEEREEIFKDICGAVASGDRSDFDSNDCFYHKESKCGENFWDALQNSYTEVEKCSEQRKLIDCLTNAVDECFGVDHDEEVLNGVKEMEKNFKDDCESVASGDRSVSDENSFAIDKRVCFDESEMDCMGDFVDALFYNSTGVDKCSELRKFVDCSTDAVDECFEDDHDEKIHKGLEELENIFQDTCGVAASGGGSDFDEETLIELTATIKKKKRKIPQKTIEKKTRVNSDSQNCSGERKICWETFESAVIHGVFYSSTGLDKCSVLRHFVLCSRQAADDCFGDKHDEDADKILEVWGNKYEEFCEVDIVDDKSVTVVVPSTEKNEREKEKQEVSEVAPEKNEVPSSGQADYLPNCIHEKWWRCRNDFMSISKGPILECRKKAKRFAKECSSVIVSCYGEGIDNGTSNEKRDQTYRYLMDSFESECNDKSLFDFFQFMVPDEYLLLGEKCLADNEGYIFECIKETSRINMSDERTEICLRWDNMSFCTKERIGEKCGEESRGRFIEQFPEMPEEVKTACETIPLVEVDNYIDLDTQNKNGEHLAI